MNMVNLHDCSVIQCFGSEMIQRNCVGVYITIWFEITNMAHIMIIYDILLMVNILHNLPLDLSIFAWEWCILNEWKIVNKIKINK